MTKKVSAPEQKRSSAHKAWSVSEYDSRCSTEIVWARNYGEARRLGAQALEIDVSEIDECKRIPELDDFEGDLLQWQIEHGWQFDCAGCMRRVCDEENGYIRVEHRGELWRGNEAIEVRHTDFLFCSERCRNDRLDRDRKRRDGIRAVRRRVLKLLPGSVIEHAWQNEYGDFVYVVKPGAEHSVCMSLEDLEAEPQLRRPG